MSEHKASRQTKTQWEFVAAIAIASAVGAAFCGAHPTGLPVIDVVYCALLGGYVSWMAACSRRWIWLPLSGAALVLAATPIGHLFGAIALALAIHAAFRSRRRDRITGAVIGALSIQALLRTDSIWFHGFTALVVGLLVIALTWSAYGTMRRRNRRKFRVGVISVAALATVAVAGLGITLTLARHNLKAGIEKSRQGLDAAKGGEQATAAREWNQAKQAFSDAHASLSTPFTKMSYLVPIASQHARVVTSAAGSGEEIASEATRAATVAPYRDLRSTDGTVDLRLVRDMQKPVGETVRTLRQARRSLDGVDEQWLVTPAQEQLVEFRDDLDGAIPDAEQANRALRVAPELLGGSGTRRYLVLFGNPSETRGLGGFIGAWAELDATNGKLTMTRHGKMGELNDATDWRTRSIKGQPEYLRRYGYLQPARFIQNISASPDFPTVSDVAEQLYPQAGGTKVDGVLYVDPKALAALLELTGPVTAEGIPMPLTSKNAEKFLLHDQYLDYTDTDERSDLLSSASEATFKALTRRKLPTISAIADTLSPMVRQRRLLMTSTDRASNAYLASIGLTGAFPEPGKGDLFAVKTSNGSANKIDYFLHRTAAYAATFDPATGHTTAKVSLYFKNDAPSSGLPDYVLGNQDTRAGDTSGRPYGSNTVRFSVYSPLFPKHMKIDTKDASIQTQRELGFYVASGTVTVPAGKMATVELSLAGDFPPSDRYRLRIGHQPIVNDEALIGGILSGSDAYKVEVAGKRSKQQLFGYSLSVDRFVTFPFSAG